jgi:acyl carrier protein
VNTPDDIRAANPSIDRPGGHDHVDVATMVLSAIADVAPEVEPELADLDHDVDVWNELQLDSMDHLAVMTRLSEQTGIEIAERNYPRLTTIRSLCDFLAAGGD